MLEDIKLEDQLIETSLVGLHYNSWGCILGNRSVNKSYCMSPEEKYVAGVLECCV